MNVFTQFAGSSLLYEGNGLAGVITDDKGLDKNGKPKANFTPGYELHSKITVLVEGPRGSLTKDLVNHFHLDGLNPQIYAIGIKELWDVQPSRIVKATLRTCSDGRSIRPNTAEVGSMA